MKTNFLIYISFAFLICGCGQKPDCFELFSHIEKDMDAGNLNKVIRYTHSLKMNCPPESELWHKADSLAQIAERISIDFSLDEKQVISRLNKIPGGFSPEDKAAWEKMGWLEWRVINGEKRYFNRAVSNLILLKNFHLNRAGRDTLIAKDKHIVFRKNHTEEILKASELKSLPSIPVEMKIDYTITVQPDAVPAGEIVRCWMPWPREDNPRQQKVALITASQSDYIISPDSAVHRTIYMEARSVKNQPLVFRVSYSFQSSGQYFNLKKFNLKPYDKTSSLYKKYTSEELPQVCFTEKIKHLADSITCNETNPEEIVKKVFYWFSAKIPWAGALEYSIVPNIPEYVLLNTKGDCGMQTFLIMSILRYKGIPVRWQSGWMMPPDGENLHDWCEVYYEGAGWIPVDVSYGLQYSVNPQTREFYISGIDSYRLIVNDGTSGILYPPKKFMRSDPYDFQRGEVEWKGANLYFDKWDYDMKIEYR
jgi:hypothetical protein